MALTDFSTKSELVLLNCVLHNALGLKNEVDKIFEAAMASCSQGETEIEQ